MVLTPEELKALEREERETLLASDEEVTAVCAVTSLQLQ
jgi:hypothetical protein